MKKRSIIYRLFMLVVLQCVLASCSDDEFNSNELYVYTRTWGSNNVSAQLTYDAEGNEIVTGTSEIVFPLYMTREAGVDVKAIVGLDESTLDAYNEANGTSLKMIPAEAL